MNLLVLFEPQGTLLLGPRPLPVLESMHEALADVYAVEIDEPPEDSFRGGATDLQKAWSLLRRAGVAEEDIPARLPAWQDYASRLYRLRADEDPVSQTVAAGARELLDALRSRGALVGVVSLEIEDIVRLRLERAGLSALAEGPGAFAGDVTYHTELVSVARGKASWPPWPRERTVLVGEGSGAICRAHSDPCAAYLLRSRHERQAIGEAEAVTYSFDELLTALDDTQRAPALNPTHWARY